MRSVKHVLDAVDAQRTTTIDLPDLPAVIHARLANGPCAGMTPYLINNGACEDFAIDVIKSLGSYPHAEVVEMVTPDFDENDLPGHFWLVYRGRHYDAEAPDGVDRWEDLPIFRRLVRQSC